MDMQEAERYFRKLFSLWQGVSEAYADNDAEATRRLSDEIDRLQLSNWRAAPDRVNAH